MIFSLPLDQVNADRLEALRTEGVSEGRHLEFKEKLPGTSESEKLEFLADVYPDGTGPLIRRLVALQTLLGMQQDADVAVRRLAALATREGGRLAPTTVFAMGMVAERYADQGRDLRARFPKVYGKVRGRPWKELQLVMKEAASAHASAPASTKER